MASILKVDTIQDQAGNNIISESANVITIGASGDTITVPAGATVSGFTSAGIDDNATSTAITIDSSERVGIGTTSPLQLLDVVDAVNPIIQVRSSVSTTGASMRVDGGINNDSTYRWLGDGTQYYQMYRDGSQNQDLRLYSNTDTAGATDILRYSINGDLRFGTNATERMRINSSGNVGIGTSSPSYKAHIQGTDGVSASIRAEATSTDSDAFIVTDNDANAWSVGIDGDNSDSWMLSNAFGLGSPKITVTTGGNVGIGTSSIDTNAAVQIENGESYLVMKDAQQMGIKLYGDDTNVIYSYDKTADSLTGGITFAHANGTMIFYTNGLNERMRINNAGKIFTNQTAQFHNCVTIGGAQFTGDFQIEVSGLTAVNGGSHRRVGMRLSYSGIAGDATNAQQKDVLINLSGLTSWSSVTPIDTGGGTIAVTVNSATSTAVTFTVTTPGSTTVGAYVATLYANDNSTMECNG